MSWLRRVERPEIPPSCAGLDLAKVERELIAAYANVTRAAKRLGVPTHDLRVLTRAHPRLINVALEAGERMLDEADAAILAAMRGDDPIKRIRAAGFILRSPAAKRRGF